jgi:hypothetical protein
LHTVGETIDGFDFQARPTAHVDAIGDESGTVVLRRLISPAQHAPNRCGSVMPLNWRISMAARKSGGKRKYGKAASKRVESAMRRRKKGTLKSGRSGKTVKSRKQAIAIGLSEARKKGAKVPRKRGSGR